MLQRLIGVSLGALVTYVLLILLNIGSSDQAPKYLGAVIVGAIVSFIWPWFIGWLLVRRARNRRDEQISREVDKQVAAQNKR